MIDLFLFIFSILSSMWAFIIALDTVGELRNVYTGKMKVSNTATKIYSWMFLNGFSFDDSLH